MEQRWRGRRPDASDAEEEAEAEEEEAEEEEAVCGLIPLKASVLSASSNYYKRARNKGSALGVSHPGDCIASGRFPEESNMGEK